MFGLCVPFHLNHSISITLSPRWMLPPWSPLSKVYFPFPTTEERSSTQPPWTRGIKQSSSVYHESRQCNRIYYPLCCFFLSAVGLQFLQGWSSKQQQKIGAPTVMETGNKTQAKSFCMKHSPRASLGKTKVCPPVRKKYARNKSTQYTCSTAIRGLGELMYTGKARQGKYHLSSDRCFPPDDRLCCTSEGTNSSHRQRAMVWQFSTPTTCMLSALLYVVACSCMYVNSILLMVNAVAVTLASPPPPPPILFSSPQMEEHCASVMISIVLELSETTEQLLTDYFPFAIWFIYLFLFRREIRHIPGERRRDPPREGPICQMFPSVPDLQTHLHRAPNNRGEPWAPCFQPRQHRRFSGSCALTACLHSLLWRQRIRIRQHYYQGMQQHCQQVNRQTLGYHWKIHLQTQNTR